MERSAQLFTLGGGHSFCDAVLYIPEEKVIFMGDLLFVDCHPTFLKNRILRIGFAFWKRLAIWMLR
ncbi:MBL fold metallo-hydrolase [Bacillus thuringiensis]|nr:MBL fold metallo-hydrolase [Bacillus thuringiensis]